MATMPTSSTGSDRRGFTLAELVVTVVIIAVVAAMAAPRLAGSGRTAQLREQAAQLLACARYAQNYAVTHRTVCRLVVDRQARRYELQCQKDPEHRPSEFVPLPGPLGRGRTLDHGVSFGRAWVAGDDSSEAACVTFAPGGRCEPAAVEITDGQTTFTLTISAGTGRCRVVESAVEALPDDRCDLDA